MANLLIDLGKTWSGLMPFTGEHKEIIYEEKKRCIVYGKKETYRIYEDGEDAIISIGYVCHSELDTMENTLLYILKSFKEDCLCELKKKLLGQFVIFIKIGNQIFLFADFAGGRNLFYSIEDGLVTTSYELMENGLKTGAEKLSEYEVYEYLALRHLNYPALLGPSTFHKKIKWLLPYEYISGDIHQASIKIKDYTYHINNEKQVNSSILASNLILALRKAIYHIEFKNKSVAVSVTGGRDSRLVAVIAAEYYRYLHHRIAVSPDDQNSKRDHRIAKRISKISKIRLDTYQFNKKIDLSRFRALTEGFAPHLNHTITPLIVHADNYDIGFGGVYGTELFQPFLYHTFDEYITKGIAKAKKYLFIEDEFWKYYEDSLKKAYQSIKNHYILKNNDERDYIRIFIMINTARFSSFIMASYNESGYEMEPYGNYDVFELALKVDPELWGYHRKLRGDATIQKVAMEKLNKRIGKIITFNMFRPMLPLKINTIILYLLGYGQNIAYKIREKIIIRQNNNIEKSILKCRYISNDWEKYFVERIEEKYSKK